MRQARLTRTGRRTALVVVALAAAQLGLAGCAGDQTVRVADTASPSAPTLSARPTMTPTALGTPTTRRTEPPTPTPTPPLMTTAPPTAPAIRTPQPVAVREGSSGRRQVALTFDADMTPGMLSRLESGEVSTWYNERVVEVLRATNTPATLFLTGLWAQTYPDVARSLAADPRFEIANHSLEHEAFSPCYTLPVVEGDSAKRAAVTESAQIIEDVTGVRPYYFRFPGGSTDCATVADVALVASEGEQAVDWTSAGDAFQPDPDAVVASVLSTIEPGAIVALHLHGSAQTANAPATAEALALLIPELRAQGYELVTLGQLLTG